jgi:hypothetical protein
MSLQTSTEVGRIIGPELLAHWLDAPEVIGSTIGEDLGGDVQLVGVNVSDWPQGTLVRSVRQPDSTATVRCGLAAAIDYAELSGFMQMPRWANAPIEIVAPTVQTAVASTLAASLTTSLYSVVDVLLDPDDYSDGFEVPSRAAVQVAWRMVGDVATICPGAPKPSAAPTGDGGISIRWKHGDREVRLRIPRSGDQPRIYFKSSGGDGVEQRITGPAIADRLGLATVG